MTKTVGYPESKAVKVWEKDDITFSIVPSTMAFMGSYYCGYCRFPKRPLIEDRYDGIATYIPVHGGITYAEEDKDGSMVYGFDCNHSGDETNPSLHDLNWVTTECERMAEGIKCAVEYEKRFLEAPDNPTCGAVLDEYHKILSEKGITFNLTENFGAMINVVIGGTLK